ncbi:proline and serine-rich protein 3 isoform X2 [Ranitomeya variabilis]|uniref:proline and serine-rich protein 3 isoform X2 n=1 Tax=Ranitomeya variabilis TaxID=490064 RepID=UPI004056A68D
MKSSVAVFSKQGDPFPTQTRARTHYRPSVPQTLNEAQKQTVLSPDRLRSLPHHLSDALSPPDLSFLVGSQWLLPGLPESDPPEPCDESWPSTEGSSKTPERDEGPADPTSGEADKQRAPGSEHSVLASESSLSSVGPVSSEGPGSSPVSNVSSSDSDGGGRTRPPPLDTAPVMPVSRPILAPFRAHPTPAPEEDILYQWRLRRKMEQAREGTMQVSTRKRSPSPPLRIPRQVPHIEVSIDPPYQVSSQGAALSAYGPSPPHVPTSYPLASPRVAPNSYVPPHLHLLCDILPCAQSRKAETVHPAAGPREDDTLHLESKRQQPPQHQAPPERPWTTAPTEEKKRKPKGDKTKPRQKGPARAMVGRASDSPVHRALEQVMSERLFSPLPSPKPKCEKRERRPFTASEEDAADPQPVEIAAHLLEEAEDSDGAEFDDDPLLQVLRDQRESLRARLRAVDSRLAELEEREPPASHHPGRSRV